MTQDDSRPYDAEHGNISVRITCLTSGCHGEAEWLGDVYYRPVNGDLDRSVSVSSNPNPIVVGGFSMTISYIPEMWLSELTSSFWINNDTNINISPIEVSGIAGNTYSGFECKSCGNPASATGNGRLWDDNGFSQNSVILK